MTLALVLCDLVGGSVGLQAAWKQSHLDVRRPPTPPGLQTEEEYWKRNQLVSEFQSIHLTGGILLIRVSYQPSKCVWLHTADPHCIRFWAFTCNVCQ
jgi:hypothetical protein